MAAAAHVRAISASQHLVTILALVDTVADGVDDDAFLHDRWGEWRRVALTTGILGNLRMVAQSPALAAVPPGAGMQPRLYRLMLPRTRHLPPTTAAPYTPLTLPTTHPT